MSIIFLRIPFLLRLRLTSVPLIGVFAFFYKTSSLVLRTPSKNSRYRRSSNVSMPPWSEVIFQRDTRPWDVCRFLVLKDSCGKTLVHIHGCPFVGKKGPVSCKCPLCLSYDTVDSYTGNIRVIFNETGHQDDWNRALLIGNPAADDIVKRYLRALPTIVIAHLFCASRDTRVSYR